MLSTVDMANQTIKVKDADFAKLNFSELYKMGRGQNVYINYNGRKPLIMQLPELQKRFELSKHENEFVKDGQTIKTSKYECTVSLDQSDPKHQEIIKKLAEFDEGILSHVKENSHQFLRNKNATLDGLKALYTPVLRYSKARQDRDEDDGKYCSIKFRLPHRDGNFNTVVMDENSELIPNEDIESFLSVPAGVRAIIKPQSIWITGGKFGTIWEAIKMSVKRSDETTQEIGFVVESDEDDVPVAQDYAEEAATEETAALDISAEPAEAIEGDEDDAEAAETQEEKQQSDTPTKPARGRKGKAVSK